MSRVHATCWRMRCAYPRSSNPGGWLCFSYGVRRSRRADKRSASASSSARHGQRDPGRCPRADRTGRGGFAQRRASTGRAGGCAALIRPTTARDALPWSEPASEVRVWQISAAHLQALEHPLSARGKLPCNTPRSTHATLALPLSARGTLSFKAPRSTPAALRSPSHDADPQTHSVCVFSRERSTVTSCAGHSSSFEAASRFSSAPRSMPGASCRPTQAFLPPCLAAYSA